MTDSIAAKINTDAGSHHPGISLMNHQQLGRRRARRRPVTRNVGVRVHRGILGLEPYTQCGLEDASEDGLGLRLTKPIALGQELSLELTVPGTSHLLSVSAEVRWCYPTGDGTFRAGVLVLERLSDDVVAALTR